MCLSPQTTLEEHSYQLHCDKMCFRSFIAILFTDMAGLTDTIDEERLWIKAYYFTSYSLKGTILVSFSRQKKTCLNQEVVIPLICYFIAS